jgi:hypothetical protein
LRAFPSRAGIHPARNRYRAGLNPRLAHASATISGVCGVTYPDRLRKFFILLTSSRIDAQQNDFSDFIFFFFPFSHDYGNIRQLSEWAILLRGET